MFFVALLSLGFTACGGDDDDDNDGGGGGGADPEGTIIVNIRNANSVNDHYDSGSYARLDGIYTEVEKSNGSTNEGSQKLRIDASDNLYVEDGKIVCVGKVSGLGAIKKIPQSGWARKAVVMPGYGYIVEGLNGSTKDYTYISHYARIYVVDYMHDTMGGVIGATIKYQCPWGA